MTETKLTAQEIAQEMLSKYGFFVVCKKDPEPTLPRVVSSEAAKGGIVPGSVPCPYVLVAEASMDDYQKQCSIAGVPAYYLGRSMYRAVAE